MISFLQCVSAWVTEELTVASVPVGLWQVLGGRAGGMYAKATCLLQLIRERVVSGECQIIRKRPYPAAWLFLRGSCWR
jgi:hypothetical protein